VKWLSQAAGVISEQHQGELATALHAMGCPSLELREPLDWDTIAALLAQFADFDERALQEAQRRFNDFMMQPLRARQRKALQHLLDLLRDHQHRQRDQSPSRDLSNTPIP